MAEIATISVDTNADGVPEEVVKTDAGEASDDADNGDQEASWQPELSEIKGIVNDLATEVRTSNQRLEAQSGTLQTLMTANTELTRQLQESHQTILELSDRIASPKAKTQSGQESEPESGSDEKKPSQPEQPEPSKETPDPPPPPEKPRPRRRSI
jgi:predicted RNase H-like nuclease (RuvC/YqgF family)